MSNCLMPKSSTTKERIRSGSVSGIAHRDETRFEAVRPQALHAAYRMGVRAAAFEVDAIFVIDLGGPSRLTVT